VNGNSFTDIAIVACGTMRLELRALKDEGFLDTEHLFFTAPGLHQRPEELERQLLHQIERAKERAEKVLVVFGGKFCYVNVDDPARTIYKIIDGLGSQVARINATHCMDMLARADERDAIGREMAGGEKVWWMTPGWVQYRHDVFKGWDQARANENFPKHEGGAIVLDAVGHLEALMAEKPEEVLEYSDWMGIPLQPYPVTLDRFKALLLEQVRKLDGLE
jgi:hypothetical protein